MQVWLPGLIEQHRNRVLRVAHWCTPASSWASCCGARTPEQPPFTDEEERGAHRARAPSRARAAQLRARHRAAGLTRRPAHRHEELRASRSRIVATADQSDGRSNATCTTARNNTSSALAVKLGLARQLVEADPATVATLLEELRIDAQTTLTELRELAHGIYPPL